VNFENDIRGQISDWLATNGYSTKGDLRALVIRYQNITRRIPPRMVWHLRLSNGLLEKALPKGIQEGLDHFMEQAKSGADLRPFLSALLRHGDYADLLRVLEENWPELLDRHALQRVTPSYKDLSDEEVKMMREGRINVAYGTPGGRTVAAMGGGITSAKTNMQDVRTSDYLAWRVRQAEEKVKQGLDSIAIHFEREHSISKEELSLQAQLGPEDAIWVSETRTRTPVWNEREGWLIATIEVGP